MTVCMFVCLTTRVNHDGDVHPLILSVSCCKCSQSNHLTRSQWPSYVAPQVRQQMEEQVAQKSSELEQYLLRVKELEDMYHRLEEALEDERGARQDEETVRRLQAR